jgi:hypothetical protein
VRRLLVVLLLVAACAPAAADKPSHPTHPPHPHQTTTTTTTTTTVPTTTTTAATTTTTAPTTTTTAPPNGCGVTMGVTVARARTTTTAGPITITQGGRYCGFYRSADPAVPAVTISTTQLVELDHARIEHAGHGVFRQANGAQLNIHDSTFQKLPTALGAAGSQRAVYAWGAVRLNFDNNLLIDGDGVYWNEGTGSAVEGSFLRNEIVNVGRYQPTELMTAFQFAQSTLGGLEVGWNKITNVFGQSDVEDVLSFFASAGTSSASIDVHHNLVDGGYALTAGPGSYTGVGINIGDDIPSYIRAHHNWVVSATNSGISIGSGHHLEIDNNVVVNDGLANGIATGPDFGNGITVWDSPSYADTPSNVSAHDNTVGYNRVLANSDLVRSDYFLSACDPPGACTNNASMADPIDATDEQAARDAWEAARAAAGVTVGPR